MRRRTHTPLGEMGSDGGDHAHRVFNQKPVFCPCPLSEGNRQSCTYPLNSSQSRIPEKQTPESPRADSAQPAPETLSMKKILFRVFLVPASIWVVCAALLIKAGCSDHLGKADMALVLGSKVEPDGTPSPRLRARLDRTVELYKEGLFPRILVSGGIGKEGHDEAAVMAAYLVKQGIPKDAIVEDNAGNTTYDSARKIAVLCKQNSSQSVFIISQYFHIPRAKLALQKFGIETVYHAHAHYVEWRREPYSITRELAGYVTYSFKKYPAHTPTAPPAPAHE